MQKLLDWIAIVTVTASAFITSIGALTMLSLTFDNTGGFYTFLKEWQTLATGLIALAIGTATIRGMDRQIAHSQSLEELKEKRERDRALEEINISTEAYLTRIFLAIETTKPSAPGRNIYYLWPEMPRFIHDSSVYAVLGEEDKAIVASISYMILTRHETLPRDTRSSKSTEHLYQMCVRTTMDVNKFLLALGSSN